MEEKINTAKTFAEKIKNKEFQLTSKIKKFEIFFKNNSD